VIARARDLRPELAVAEAVAAIRVAPPCASRPALAPAPQAPDGAVERDPPRGARALRDRRRAGRPVSLRRGCVLARPTGDDAALGDTAAGWRLIAAIAHRRGARHLEAHALDSWEPWPGLRRLRRRAVRRRWLRPRR
jgi:hypothetical protein